MLLLAAAAFYGNFRTFPASRPVTLEGQRFPEGFLWATGEDAYQHEGGNLGNDWAEWEARSPSPIANSDRCGIAADFYNRFEEDFNRALSDGQNAHRIGIEWSRAEPGEGHYSVEAWDRYELMLRSLKEKGFTVFFNLWHFTLPLWASKKGGFENPDVRSRWEEFVRRCALRFGKYVDYWSTMIDAQIYALAGYAVGDIPPNITDMSRAVSMYRQLILLHSRAYKIIKEHAVAYHDGKTVSPSIGMIYFFFYYRPKGFFIDRLVKKTMDDIFNWNMLDALYTGRVRIRVPAGPSIDESHEEAKGTLDWIGVNYYTREILSFSPSTPGFIKRGTVKNSTVTDMGWEIYPEGLYHIGNELHRRYQGVPIFITESGLADAKDEKRPRFILDHLVWTHRMIQDGIPIKGFTYWSLTDNWEWSEGYRPKFGLYRIDRNTMDRSETGSARLYRFIAFKNRLPREEELHSILYG